MDLSIDVAGVRVKVRVAAIVRGAHGFIFEKSDKGYLFLPGGKVMASESSAHAVKREIFEELAMEPIDVKLIGVLENFYSSLSGKTQEICFIYRVGGSFAGVLPEGFKEVPQEFLKNEDIRPIEVLGLITAEDCDFKHIISLQE